MSASMQRADFAGDFAHPREINDARIGARADGDHLGLVLPRQFGELIVIDPFVLLAHAVMDDFEKLAGEIGLVAVRQMAAVRQVHRQHLVARLEKGEINRHVRAAAGMGLDIGMLRAEQLAGAVDGQLLDRIHVLAAAVPALLGIALGVFVGEHGALRFHHRRAGEVFAGNQFDVFLLALLFQGNGQGDFRVNGFQVAFVRRR